MARSPFEIVLSDEERAELERRLFDGEPIPGWKVVQGKRGNRSWTDEEAVKAKLKQLRQMKKDKKDG